MSSRERDLVFIDEQAQGVLQDIEGIKQRFDQWNAQQAEKIQALMEEAGILDQINAIEESRKEMLGKAQGQIDVQKDKLKDFQKIKNFLVQREQMEASSPKEAPAPKPEAPAPVEVPVEASMSASDPLGIGQPRVLTEMEVLTGKKGIGE